MELPDWKCTSMVDQCSPGWARSKIVKTTRNEIRPRCDAVGFNIGSLGSLNEGLHNLLVLLFQPTKNLNREVVGLIIYLLVMRATKQDEILMTV
jgi:hypothetical protein